MVGAVINAPGADIKIEKIVTMTAHGEVCDKTNLKNLNLLIEKSAAHARARYDELCEQITTELSALSDEELAAFPDLTYTKPSQGAEQKTRKKII